MSYERDTRWAVERQAQERRARELRDWCEAHAKELAQWKVEHGEENRRKEISELKCEMDRIKNRLRELGED